ncbi:MAG: hypothetical protein A2020_13285 [Lentisphaerae bacterium GWF2_45_14]|nr:MAG: hypothetical protein A2020_13285 [Lentisphaerae bacterium GWF2_45_14]
MHSGREYKLRPGFIHIIPENTDVRLYCASKMDQFYIHFRAELLGGLSFFKAFDCGYELKIGKSDNIKESVGRLEKLYREKSPPACLEMDGILRTILARIIERNFDGSGSAPRELIRFKAVFEYMERNYSKKVRLADLAARANLQEIYFSNLFKKACGIPPMQFLNRKRIEKAQSLLLSSDEKLETIAAQCGFDDVFHFSKTFRKFTATPPSEYRRNKKALLS